MPTNSETPKQQTADPTADSAKKKIPIQATTLFELAPKFATSIQCKVLADAFILEFFYSAGEEAVYLSRIAISADHAKRLRDLLTRQLQAHEEHSTARADSTPAKKATRRRSAKTKSKT